MKHFLGTCVWVPLILTQGHILYFKLLLGQKNILDSLLIIFSYLHISICLFCINISIEVYCLIIFLLPLFIQEKQLYLVFGTVWFVRNSYMTTIICAKVRCFFGGSKKTCIVSNIIYFYAEVRKLLKPKCMHIICR